MDARKLFGGSPPFCSGSINDIAAELAKCNGILNDMVSMCTIKSTSCGQTTFQCEYDVKYTSFKCNHVALPFSPSCCDMKCGLSPSTFIVRDICGREQKKDDIINEVNKCRGDFQKIAAFCTLELQGSSISFVSVRCPYEKHHRGWKCSYSLPEKVKSYCCKYKCAL